MESNIDSIPSILCDDGYPSLGSPLIDAGIESVAVEDTTIYAPTIDLVGTPRPLGEGIDIGAYEYDPTNPVPATQLAEAEAVRIVRATL